MSRAAEETPRLRLDKWLWHARIVRTRSLAAQLCASGKVAVGDSPAAKPHHQVRVGDQVSVALNRMQRRLLVRALGVRRGPPAEAKLLYDEPEPPALAPEAPAAWTPLLDEESWA